MSKYTHHGFFKSFITALKGLFMAFRSQHNFRIQSLVSLIVVTLAFILHFSYIEFCILIIAIALVMVAELFNSVIEFSLDAYYKNKYSKLVKISKDMAAAGVLIATSCSIILGSILFLHKIIILMQ